MAARSVDASFTYHYARGGGHNLLQPLYIASGTKKKEGVITRLEQVITRQREKINQIGNFSSFPLFFHSVKIRSLFDTKFFMNSHILQKLGKIANTRLARDLYRIRGVSEIFCYCTVLMDYF